MSLRQVLAQARAALQKAGAASPRLDAELLLAHALGVDRGRLFLDPEQDIPPPALARFAAFCARRQAGEPVSHILGEREFWSLPFTVNSHVLDPRPDSETLIEAALALKPQGEVSRILDLGTGSGCLLVALLHEYAEAQGVGVDISREALAVAAENAARNGVAARTAFVAGGWDAALPQRFDLVVANPPYILSEDIAGLAREVRDHEPHLALDGGADGLRCYGELVQILGSYLACGGIALLEVGQHQGAAVMALAAGQGLVTIGRRQDLSGIERCIILQHR